MQIIFLGTSSGTPTKERNVSGVAIKSSKSKQWHLVDCGEGTQHQILKTNLSLINLGAIFITHVHGDHCYGLPGLLASAGMSGRREPLYIVGPKDIEGYIKSVQQYTQFFLPYDIQYVDVSTFNNASLNIDLETDVIELSHRVPSYGYSFASTHIEKKLLVDKLKAEEIPAGPIWGKLQQGIDHELESGGVLKADHFIQKTVTRNKVIICGDNDSPKLLAPYSDDADVIIHESTYTHEVAQKVGEGPMHCSALKIAQFAEDAGLNNLILTHFSPRFQSNVEKSPSIFDIENEASAAFSGNLFLAQDFDEFELKLSGELVKKSV